MELTEPLHMSTECQLVYDPSNLYLPSKLYLLSSVRNHKAVVSKVVLARKPTVLHWLAELAHTRTGFILLSQGVFIPEEPR